MITWIDDDVQLLGQTQVEEEVTALQKEEESLSTGDKVLMASLFLSVASLAWQIWTWRKEKS